MFAIAVAAVTMLPAVCVGHLRLEVPSEPTSFILWLIFILAIAIIANGVFFSGVALLVALIAMLPLGGQIALAAPFVRLGIESTPVGTHVVHQFESTSAFLEHSSGYSDRKSIERIKELIAMDLMTAEIARTAPRPPT
jgi:hypothetical protein